MPKNRINVKECDPQSPCIDLNELSSYLLIPSKFVTPQQQIKIYSSRRRAEIYYSIDQSHLDHSQTQWKRPTEDQELEFFGIKHPNGRIEKFTIRRTKQDLIMFHVYVKRYDREIVTIKDLTGGNNEEKDIKPTLSRRAMQQRLTFGDLCRRDPAAARNY